MPKMLIADGEAGSRQYIRQYAEYEGYTVLEAADGEQAIASARQHAPDVILLDLILDRINGQEVLKSLRAFTDAPILICSARSEESDRLTGFSLGADDFVPKPYSPRELMMRVSAIRKRVEAQTPAQSAERYASGGFAVEYAARKVTLDGRRVDLSPKEYDLLCYLVRNRNIALTRDQLITQIWGADFSGDERTLDTHIKLLRRKIGAYARCIVTIRGVGYRFES